MVLRILTPLAGHQIQLVLVEEKAQTVVRRQL
jgi:hypothetical protein